MDFQEVELKLCLNKTSYDFFFHNYAAHKIREQHNFFMDTKAFDLLKSKWVFRLRDEGDQAFMTLKGSSQVEQGVYIRPEYEEALKISDFVTWYKGFSVKSIDLGQLSKAPIHWPDGEFQQYASFSNRRSTIQWEGFFLELDCFSIKNNIYYELECETSPEKLNKLSKMLKDFFLEKHMDFTFSEKSKFQILLEKLDLDKKLI